MKREIKFRAWDPDVKKMIYAPAALRRVTYNEECNGFHMGRVKSKDNGDWVQFEIMQFTGLKDKNGKDIYEGDLIKCVGAPSGHSVTKERLCKVVQDTFGWTIVIWHQKEWWSYGKMNFSTIDIIGNIYENPELLKS